MVTSENAKPQTRDEKSVSWRSQSILVPAIATVLAAVISSLIVLFLPTVFSRAEVGVIEPQMVSIGGQVHVIGENLGRVDRISLIGDGPEPFHVATFPPSDTRVTFTVHNGVVPGTYLVELVVGTRVIFSPDRLTVTSP